MKRVLVIEDKDGGFNAVVHKIMKARTIRSARQFIDDYSSPGNLLAEFKAEFRNEHDIAYSDEVAKMLRNKIWEKQNITVLILACTDAGSEVKK